MLLLYINVLPLSYGQKPATTHRYGASSRFDAPHESHLRVDSSAGRRIDVVVSEDSPTRLAVVSL